MNNYILNIIQEEVIEEVLENVLMHTEKLYSTCNLTTASIFNGLSYFYRNGNLNDIVEIFNGKSGSLIKNPIIGEIAYTFLQSLKSNGAINCRAASEMSVLIIPPVMERIIYRTKNLTDQTIINNIRSLLQTTISSM